MPLLPSRRFARLDRARLPDRALAAALPPLCRQVDAFVDAHADFAADGRVRDLHLVSQGAVDLLCGAFGLPRRPVLLRDRPRPHRRRQGRIVYELHGLCVPDGPLELYARTAARAQPVAPATLLNTLLHEWMHHWDLQVLRDSVHCRGFYRRIDQLFGPVRGRVPPARRPKGVVPLPVHPATEAPQA